jgi:putative flippase GtrA
MTPSPRLAGFDFGRLLRFGSVGVASTLIYAALGWSLTVGARLGAAPASVLAYALACVFSYFGHKGFTFRSSAAHAVEAPKFIAAAAVGLAIASAAPLILTDGLHLPPIVAIAFTCVAVPAINYLILDLIVFARRPDDGQP